MQLCTVDILLSLERALSIHWHIAQRQPAATFCSQQGSQNKTANDDWVGMQAVSIAEAQVTEAQQRLMQLEQDKAELDTQLRKTQEAVLTGKQRVENLRQEVRRRTEARTVKVPSFATRCFSLLDWHSLLTGSKQAISSQYIARTTPSNSQWHDAVQMFTYRLPGL